MISIAYSLPTRGELRDMASEIWLYKTASMAVANGTTVQILVKGN